jgi:hypothetical protein
VSRRYARATLAGAVVALGVCVCARDAGAIGSAKGDDASITATGTVWLLGAYFHNWEWQPPLPTPPDDGIAAGTLRLILDGDLPKQIGYEANFYFELSRGPTALGAQTFYTASSFVTPYRTRYLAWNFWQKDTVLGQMAVDRLRVHRSFGPVDISIGRFPINHSVTFLFTPNDFFAPFAATTLNKTYKPGVDALRINIGLGALSGLEVLGVLGSGSDGVPAWSSSAVTARLETVLAGFHGSVIGGKLAQRWIVGGTIQGDIKGVGLRAEGHFGMPDKDGDGHIDGPLYGQLAARIEHSWPWHNLNIGAEYAFFSDGADMPSGYIARAALFFPDELPYLGEHYVGVNAAMDIIAILNIGVVGLVNAADGSGITTLSLTYNASNEVDLSLGMLAGWGYRPRANPDGTIRVRSEFGATPITAFFQTNVAF